MDQFYAALWTYFAPPLTLRLRDSKTGPRVVPLSPAAARVLAGLPRAAANPWVIAGRNPGMRLPHITLLLVSRAGARGA